MGRIRTFRGWVALIRLLASAFHPVHAAGQDPAAEPGSGTFRDPRDGEWYAWVKIGEQVWMAENLRFATPSGSMCWENREEECSIRGRHFTWDAAMEAAPPGWHLPTDEEWMKLEMTLGLTRAQAEGQGRDRGGPGNTIGATLKKVGEWAVEFQGRPVPVTNESGFSAIPAGLFAQEQFFHEGYTGWWSASAEGGQAWVHGLRFFDSRMGRDLNAKEFGFSVRCVRDTPGG
jgi:uncharacterized protein (TIGR02145 family)